MDPRLRTGSPVLVRCAHTRHLTIETERDPSPPLSRAHAHSVGRGEWANSTRYKVAATVTNALFVARSRKSRCDGNKPCAACVARGRTDDCIYTISRRGGKPKPKVDPTAGKSDGLMRLMDFMSRYSPAHLSITMLRYLSHFSPISQIFNCISTSSSISRRCLISSADPEAWMVTRTCPTSQLTPTS